MRTSNVIQEIIETLKFWNLLLDDMDYARALVDKSRQELMTNSPTLSEAAFLARLQPGLRFMIRNEITAMDGICYRAKLLAWRICEYRKVDLTRGETEKILERRIDKNGKEKRYYLKTKQNIIFALRMLHRAMGSDFVLTDTENWKKLCDTIGMRNRITHPKKLEDLSVTTEEYTNAADGLGWLLVSVKNLNKALLDFRSNNRRT